MELILVSSCLLGSPVRYNGSHKLVDNAILSRWLREGRVVAVCPEVAGGMPIPRPAAEIVGGGGGTAVLAGWARVVDSEGNDVSQAFSDGANTALRQVRSNAIRLAVLKEDSPSCGSSFIYDGRFNGNRIREQGVTAALLEREGVRVFSEAQFNEAEVYLRSLETDG